MRKAFVVLVSCVLFGNESTDKLLQTAEGLIEKEQFAEAAALLEQAAKSGPSAQVSYRLGYVQFRQRKLIGARRNFNEVLKLAPPALDSRYFLGRIALLENKPQEAVTWLKPVAESPETTFDAHAQLAKAYLALGQSAKAVPELKAAAAQTPWDDGIPYRLGQIYQKLGKPELAAEEFNTARRLKGIGRDDAEVLLQVAQLLNMREVRQAVALGSKIRDRAGADPSTVHALGVLYGTANLPAEALQAFDIAASRDPKFFQAQFNRGVALLKANRVQEALPALKQAVELLPQSPEANMTLGLAAVMNRDYAASVQPLARAWQADSSNPRVGLLLATAYIRTGEASKALPVLKTIPATEPTPLFLSIEALNASGDTAAALEAAKTAAAQFPSVPQSRLALAQQLARVGRYQDARPEFEAALQLAPGLAEAELGLADSLQKAGDHAGAVPHYRASLSGATTALAARLGLARSLASLKQLDEATSLLEEALPQYPSDATIRQELSRIYARAGKTEQAKEQARIAEQLKAQP